MALTQIKLGGIANLAVDTAQLAADAVTGDKIEDSAVDTEHIATSAVETAKINADAVTNAKIADGQVDTEHLAADAVENAKIADNAVDTEHLADDAVNSDELAGGAIDAAHLASGIVSDQAATGWWLFKERGAELASSAVFDFDGNSSLAAFVGTSNSESAGTVTVGVAGWYLIGVVLHNDAGTDTTLKYEVRKNGSSYGGRGYLSGASETMYPTGGQNINLFDLAANDTVDVYGQGSIYGDSGAQYGGMCSFWGIRVGT